MGGVRVPMSGKRRDHTLQLGCAFLSFAYFSNHFKQAFRALPLRILACPAVPRLSPGKASAVRADCLILPRASPLTGPLAFSALLGVRSPTPLCAHTQSRWSSAVCAQ